MDNNINNITFGARVKFSTNDNLKNISHMSTLKTVEKVFKKETKGIKGDLNIHLYTQGRMYPTLYTGVSYRNGKYEDSFNDMKDEIFFDTNAKPRKMVNKLKNILNFFEERKAYNDTITKKEKEIKSIQNQMNKIAEKKVVVRWAIYYILIFSILIFGIYGKGYNASSFIYGNF